MNHSSITNKLHVNVSITDHTNCPATHTARVTWSAANPHSATQCAAAAMQWQAQATLETPLSCLWPPLTKLAHAGSKEPPALITTHWPVGHIHYHWPAMASDITPGQCRLAAPSPSAHTLQESDKTKTIQTEQTILYFVERTFLIKQAILM